MKILVELTDEQRERVEAICREEGSSESQVVSEALDAFFDARERGRREHKKLDPEERVRIRLAAAGLWKDHATEGDEYLEQLRSEWDR